MSFEMMNSRFYTKFLPSALIVSLLIPSALFLYPQKTDAAGATCAVVVATAIASVVGTSAAGIITGVPTNSIENNVADAATTGASYGTFFKDCILTPLAIQLAKAMLRNITMSIVTWINNGFEGQPSFVQDFGGLITDTTDQVLGSFIDNEMGLGFLCNSFSLQIRIALAQSALPYQQRARCTLSQIQQNVNGFVQGDNSGGWDNWLSVTTEPQNNIYGATILAQNELSQRVAKKLDIQNRVLDWGKGFRSWESCDEFESQLEADSRIAGTQTSTTNTDPNSFENFNTGNTVSFDGGKTNVTLPKQTPSFTNTKTQSNKPQCKPGKMTTKTPGTVIENQLALSLGSGIRQLEIAQDIEAIVGALTNQLMSKVITGAQGLLGAHKNSSGGSSSPTTYQQALNPTVDPNLSTAIDSGIENLNKDTNFDKINTPTATPAPTATPTVDESIHWASIKTPNTVTSSAPLTYEINLVGPQTVSSMTVTTTLKKNGVPVPFLSAFSALQLSYGLTDGTISNRVVSSRTDAGAAWSNVSIKKDSGFIVRYTGPKNANAPTGMYTIETNATDENDTLITATSTEFLILP